MIYRPGSQAVRSLFFDELASLLERLLSLSVQLVSSPATLICNSIDSCMSCTKVNDVETSSKRMACMGHRVDDPYTPFASTTFQHRSVWYKTYRNRRTVSAGCWMSSLQRPINSCQTSRMSAYLIVIRCNGHDLETTPLEYARFIRRPWRRLDKV